MEILFSLTSFFYCFVFLGSHHSLDVLKQSKPESEYNDTLSED